MSGDEKTNFHVRKTDRTEDWLFDLLRNVSDNVKDQSKLMTEHMIKDQERFERFSNEVKIQIESLGKRISSLEEVYSQIKVIKWLMLAIFGPILAAGGVTLFTLVIHAVRYSKIVP